MSIVSLVRALVFRSVSSLVTASVCLMCIIYLMITQIQLIRQLKWKYVQSVWSYIDVVIIACAWTCVGICVWRYLESNRIADLFRQTNGYVYINLQVATHVHDVFVALLGCCCFCGSMKILRLLEFHRHLSMFHRTMAHAFTPLLSFMLMFAVVFVAFLSLFYLLFSDRLLTCSTVGRTTAMLFEMILMKFDGNELYQASPVLGPLSFTLFIFIAVFTCMSMFITIISDSFRFVRDYAKTHRNMDHQVLMHMFRRFQCSLGEINESQQQR
jgi:hypothetical protein